MLSADEASYRYQSTSHLRFLHVSPFPQQVGLHVVGIPSRRSPTLSLELRVVLRSREVQRGTCHVPVGIPTCTSINSQERISKYVETSAAAAAAADLRGVC
jgi:hypothetical protein